MKNYNKHNSRILVVDDTLKNIQVVGKILREQGFKVSVAQSGKNALEIVRKTPPDLILLDIIMPEMDGFETCKRLKEDEANRTIPVIFLSALAETKNKVKGFKIGAVDYVTKPIEAEELLSRIDLHLTVKNLQENLEKQVDTQTRELLTTNEALRKREDDYRSVMKAVPDPIIVYNMDMCAMYLNPAFTRVFGWSLEEMVDIREHFVVDGEWEKTRDAIDTVFRDGYISGFETGRHTKKGEILDVSISGAAHKNSSGEVIGMVVNLRDITKLKQTRETIIQSEKRYRLLADNATDNIWILQLANLKLSYSSPSVERILGYSAEEMLSIELENVIKEESLQKIYDMIALELVREKKEGFHHNRHNILELKQIRKDGSEIWTEVTASFLRDKNNKPDRVLGITRDITERKQLETQLQKSQKMEAIGTLAGGIAHDFNNILSSVFGFAELVKLKLNGDDKIKRNVDQILAAGIRARDLVRHILTFSRQADVEKSIIKISPLIKESLNFIRATVPKNIEIRQYFDAAESKVLADSSQVQQIVMNLFTNATQSMKKRGGVLDVSLKEVEIMGDEAEKLKQGKYVKLAVTDNGCGIDKKDMEKIFEPFFTTKPRGEGTGLGLSTVYGIINNMGGTISVNSEPETGTTFTVFFPEHHGSAKDIYLPNSILIKGKGKILLVDDEEPIVNWCRQLLIALGYDVVGKTSSKEALNIFKKNSKLFDLVITDMAMSEMTGIELSMKLIDIRSDIPIILCTGFNEELTPEVLKKSGVLSVIMKPMVASEFAEAINNALKGIVVRDISVF
ncbi:MAG: response regulator [Deltaproteobacteria bacterium]|nr:response regulator [Deltaproteobacteria bacterium]